MSKTWTHSTLLYNFKDADVGDLLVCGDVTWILRTKREHGEWVWDVLDPFDKWVNEARANAAK